MGTAAGNGSAVGNKCKNSFIFPLFKSGNLL